METALFFHKAGEPISSDYTAHTSVLSPVRKDKTHRWSRQNLSLQRAGLAAGLEAVRKWAKHKRNLNNNLDYWTGRAEKDPDDPKVLRKRSVAEQKLSKHREAGTKRLFRRRHEEESCSGAALVYGERARLISTERGVAVKLSGGLVLSLREKGFALPEGHTFTGAVQVVDITDIKGKVTRRTLPEHRTYNIHLRCTMKAPAPKEVENEFDILGVDLGIDHPAYRSDGGSSVIATGGLVGPRDVTQIWRPGLPTPKCARRHHRNQASLPLSIAGGWWNYEWPALLCESRYMQLSSTLNVRW